MAEISGRRNRVLVSLAMLAGVVLLGSCAPANVPGARSVNIPAPVTAEERRDAINERPDPVMYLPLGADALMPTVADDDPMPNEYVGPFELRAETLAGALQLILSDYDVSLAFQSDEGLTRRITVANLRGPLDQVVREVCGLANLYCAYSKGLLTVKETQTFTVKVPPLSQDTSFIQNVAAGLTAIIGKAPVIDTSTHTIIYEATQRNAEMAERYFQRMRTSTALIIFETYIWEVELNSGNSTGIKWNQMLKLGKYSTNLGFSGSVGTSFTNPISIGLPTVGSAAPNDIFSFLSTFGAVKTVSQPQITVLAGSEAKLRAANTENYVAQVAQTIDAGQSTTSVNTASVDTGFTLKIGSAWDNATVYANIDINLSDVSEIKDFDFSTGNGGTTKVQLPKTTERELTTQVRIRPGDSLLLAGLVRENDGFSSTGAGFMKPFLPSSRTATTENLELVFLLRPRVVVFTSETDQQYNTDVRQQATTQDKGFHYDFAPLVAGQPQVSTTTPVPLSSDGRPGNVFAAQAAPAPASAGLTPVSQAPVMPIMHSDPVPLSPMSASPMSASAMSARPAAAPARNASGSGMPMGSLSSDALNPGAVSRAP